MTIIAAKIAKSVSQTEIWRAELWMFASFFIYEPYVIMMPIASDME